MKTIYFKSCLGVFQGGGCRSAAHAGAYEAAVGRGVHFTQVAGTSGGSIVAALIGAGAQPDFLIKVLTELDFNKFLGVRENPDEHVGFGMKAIKRPLLRALGQKQLADVLRWGGLHSSLPIQDWMEKLLRRLLPGKNRPILMGDLIKPTYIVATDLLGTREVVWGPNNKNVEVAFAVRASCSIPGFFQPVKVGKNRYVDGGVLSNLPAFVFGKQASRNERILAFRLMADYSTPDDWSASELMKRLLKASIEGATELQSKIQGNVHTITIPTGDIVATDFAKMNYVDDNGKKTNIDKLINSGRDATNKFFDGIFKQTTSSSPITVLVDQEEVYLEFIHLSRKSVDRLIIAFESTRWVWDLFPTLLHLRMKGTNIYVLAHPAAGDPEKLKEENLRRSLLEDIGVNFCEVAELPARGIIFDGDQPLRSRGVIYTQHDKPPENQALSLAAPVQFDLLLAMWKMLQPLIPGDTNPYIPEIESIGVTELFRKLQNVSQYSMANIDLRIDTIPIHNALILPKYIREYRLDQVPYLDELYEKINVSYFEPIAVKTKRGRLSIVTPPVVEEYHGGHVVIEGESRFFHCHRNNIEAIKCVIVKCVEDPLPAKALSLNTAQLTSCYLKPKDRMIDWDYNHFRNIENAVHSP